MSLHAVEFVNDVAELVLHVTDAVYLKLIVSRGSCHHVLAMELGIEIAIV